MRYELRLLREATKTLDRLDRRTEARIRKQLYALRENPFPHPGADIKPLQGHPGWWRLRVGDWRVLYSISREEQVVHVAAILPRGQAYRQLPDR